jgi:multicomponent Na+:H+ antiporter subunit B
LNAQLSAVFDVVLMALVVATALVAVSLRNLVASAMVLGVYSLLLATVWIQMQAPDVAFTEAAVGAGISTIILLETLIRANIHEKPRSSVHWPALSVSVLLGAALVYAGPSMPTFRDGAAPIHQTVAPRYIERSREETHVPNMVTAVLASYRGFDTLFETAVVFTAGLSVVALLRRREGGVVDPDEDDPDEDDPDDDLNSEAPDDRGQHRKLDRGSE